MVNPYRHDAKKSHIDKLSRMCGGGHAGKKAHGGSAKPAIAHRKHGGKVMHADGHKAHHHLGRKKRAEGGALTAEQRRLISQGKDPFAEGILPSGGRRAKGGHVDAADLAADKKLVKRAMSMHDRQEHHGEHTDLSKLKRGGHVHHRATGGRLPGGVTFEQFGVEIHGRETETQRDAADNTRCNTMDDYWQSARVTK